jgi:hypothetical protein
MIQVLAVAVAVVLLARTFQRDKEEKSRIRASQRFDANTEQLERAGLALEEAMERWHQTPDGQEYSRLAGALRFASETPDGTYVLFDDLAGEAYLESAAEVATLRRRLAELRQLRCNEWREVVSRCRAAGPQPTASEGMERAIPTS